MSTGQQKYITIPTGQTGVTILVPEYYPEQVSRRRENLNKLLKGNFDHVKPLYRPLAIKIAKADTLVL
jgi:hypothetical protein